MKAQLYASAVAVACERATAAIEGARQRARAGMIAEYPLPKPTVITIGKWWWKSTETVVPSDADMAGAQRAAEKYADMRLAVWRTLDDQYLKTMHAVAVHKQPATILEIDGAALDLIAPFLEPYISDRI